MELLSFAGGAVCGVAMACIIIEIIKKSSMDMKNQKINQEQLLEECFGEAMYASTYSFEKAKKWIKAHEQLLKNGANALVMKVNEETMKVIKKDVNIEGEPENYLVIAIINEKSQQMEESLLVKYGRLDANLENILAKGNGMLVVEGE